MCLSLICVVGLSAQNKKAEKLIKKGNAALEENRFVGASVHFTNALTHDPQNADAYYLRGYSFLSLDQRDQAEKDFREALRYDPKLEFAYVYLIPMLREDDRCDEAFDVIDQLAKQLPENGGAAEFQRALCYEQQSKIPDAIEAYQNAAAHFSSMGKDFEQVLKDCQLKIEALRKL